MLKHASALVRLLCLCTLLVVVPASAQSSGPNDPYFSEQYALELTGALCAWQGTFGSSNVTVAVVDSGVDMTHPDLVAHLRTDGYDFSGEDSDPSDENGHGTNVAGIIAATVNNAEGIAGLAPDVSILPVRVMNAEGYGSDNDIARGIRYAADQGAQVINLSLGATVSDEEPESLPVSDAIRYAQEKGALVVVAAGNDFVDLPNVIVGDNPDVLVVAATDPNDRKARFSNYGKQISVAAPGVHILSTMPTYPVYLTSDELPDDERFKQDYDYMSGTSQATPYVSALAALLFSAQPGWDAAQVRQTLVDTSADISAQNQRLTEQGLIGRGRIDACAALQQAGVAQGQQPTAVPDEPTPTLEPDQPTPTAEQERPTTAPFVPQPTPRRPTPIPDESSSSGGAGLLGVLAGLALCAAVVFGVVLLFAVGRRGRRRAVPTPPAPYTPPAQQPAPVAAQGAWGTLVVIGGPVPAGSFPLLGAVTAIGRAPDNNIVLANDQTVSRRHAFVRNDGRAVMVEDAGSTHGTYLNGTRLATPVQVKRGDVVQIGQTMLRFD